MTTRDRLLNWGTWARSHTGPQGYPTVTPMFRDADTSKWHEEAWGDNEAALPEIQDPIDERDAEYIDKLVSAMAQERLKTALLIEFARTPRVFHYRRWNYADSVAEAFRWMEQALTYGIRRSA